MRPPTEHETIVESSESRAKTRRYYRRMNRTINYLNSKHPDLDAGEKAQISNDLPSDSHPYFYHSDYIYDSDSNSITDSPPRAPDPDSYFDCPYTDNLKHNKYEYVYPFFQHILFPLFFINFIVFACYVPQ